MRWIILAIALLFSTGASAQCSGTIPNGYICGNLSGQQGPFAGYPFATFSCVNGCTFGNGFANGARWNNNLGSADAALYESPGNNFIAQTGLNGTFSVTDQNANFLLQIAGPIPQAQGGTTNGNNYSFSSNICSIADEDFTVSGTATATESPGFTYKVGSTTVTITYTVQPGDTNNNITAGLIAAIKNSVAMAGIINGICPNGNYYNGTVTAVQFSSTRGGFDVIYTADPNLSGNAWTAINTTHTTVTLTPVSFFGGQPGEIWSAFITGRNAVAGDSIYVGSYIFQDNTAAASTYLTDLLLVADPTAGATQFQREWLTPGGCGYDWITSVGVATFSALNCDLHLVANSSTGNNISIATGSAGTINITPGSGGVQVTGSEVISGTLQIGTPLAVAQGGTGSSSASGARTNLGVPSYTASTWTPVITTDATVGTPAYTTQLGTYEQIGRQITARFNIQLSGWTGSPTGNVKISGLPVANVGNYGTCTVSFYSAVNLANAASGISGIIADTASAIDLYSMQNTSTIKLTAAALTTVGGVVGWCSYHN